MVIDCIAEYIPDGDTILATVYVLDEVEEIYHPELVRIGTATILFLNNPITKPINFDRRMGNKDGEFNFVFSHPPKIKNLQFKVTVTLMDNSVFTKTVGLLVEGESNIPLAENTKSKDDARSI